MVLFPALAKILPAGVSLKSPLLTSLWKIYKDLSRSDRFKKIYPSIETFLRAVEGFWFALEATDWVMYVEQTCEGSGLRVHGLFWGNPFRDLARLRETALCLFQASSVERIEVVILGGASRGLRRLLEQIGFAYEGTLRKAFRALPGELLDGGVFSMIREEE